jgi:energy-coupling factor transporter transmembrane protein EcfT
MAMVSRGYDGEVRTLPLPRLGASDWATLAFGLVILLFLLMLAILFWG